MIGKDWTDVKIAANPNSDVLATGKAWNEKKGKYENKITYNPKFAERNAGLKFERTREGLEKYGEMFAQNQANRSSKDAGTKDAADVIFLMQIQGTRPGSEADRKGLEKLYGKRITADDVIVTPGEGKEKTKVELKVGDHTIHIRDEGAAE